MRRTNARVRASSNERQRESPNNYDDNIQHKRRSSKRFLKRLSFKKLTRNKDKDNDNEKQNDWNHKNTDKIDLDSRNKDIANTNTNSKLNELNETKGTKGKGKGKGKDKGNEREKKRRIPLSKRLPTEKTNQIRSITPDPTDHTPPHPTLNRDRSQSDITTAPIIGVSPPPPKANSLSLSYRKHLIQMNKANRNRKNKSIPKGNTNLASNTSKDKINIHVNNIDDDRDDIMKLAEGERPSLGMQLFMFFVFLTHYPRTTAVV